jgi:hypothetical protein
MSAFTGKNRIRTAVIITAALFFTSPHTGIRTATGHPDDTTGNTGLAESLKKGSIGELTWWGGTPVAEQSPNGAAHTSLRPAGRRQSPFPRGTDEDEAEIEYYRIFDSWSCMYSALSAMDGEPPPRGARGKTTRESARF